MTNNPTDWAIGVWPATGGNHYAGTHELPGYTIVTADNLRAAVEIACYHPDILAALADDAGHDDVLAISDDPEPSDGNPGMWYLSSIDWQDPDRDTPLVVVERLNPDA